jgi:RNA polymerase sigma factor (sigma-70 family)
MSDYLARIKIQNGRINRLMRERGITNQAELARLAGVTPSAIGDILNFKVSPITQGKSGDAGGRWRTDVIRVADALGVLPDELFSPEQITMKLKKNTGEKEITLADVMGSLGASLDQEREMLEHYSGSEIEEYADFSRMKALLDGAMDLLPARQRRVLEMRFGLNGAEEKHYEEIGEQLGVSLERVRQIEDKAIRSLRARAVTGILIPADDFC